MFDVEDKYFDKLEESDQLYTEEDKDLVRDTRRRLLLRSCEHICKRLNTIRQENGSWPQDMPLTWRDKYDMCFAYITGTMYFRGHTYDGDNPLSVEDAYDSDDDYFEVDRRHNPDRIAAAPYEPNFYNDGGLDDWMA